MELSFPVPEIQRPQVFLPNACMKLPPGVCLGQSKHGMETLKYAEILAWVRLAN